MLLTICCCLSAASGQWLEKTIWLPDSAGGISRPRCLAYDSVHNRVFVAGSSAEAIIVLDAHDGHRLTGIPFSSDVQALCFNPVSNKVYAAAGGGLGVIAVIDANTNVIVETLTCGVHPLAFAHNPTLNRVYCANSDGSVTVVDGAGDSVLATVSVGGDPIAICWNPTRNVAYVASEDPGEVSVIDATTDSVLDAIPTESNPYALAYNPELNKLYVTDDWGRIMVIDGLADTVVATIDEGDFLDGLCYNPANGKVYVADEDGCVIVVDCAADTVLDRVSVYGAYDVVCSPLNNRVCTAGWSEIAVIDGTTDQVVAEVGFENGVYAVCVADSGRRALGLVRYDAMVGVVDCANGSLVGLTSTLECPYVLCFNPISNKAYCVGDQGTTVTVIDGTADSIRVTIPVLPYLGGLIHDPVGNKVYCGRSAYGIFPGGLTVIDGDNDSVLRTVELGESWATGEHDLCLNSATNQVYVGNSTDAAVAVVDAVADTMVCTIVLSDAARALCYGPAYNYVYVATYGLSVNVIDADLNLVIADVAVGSGPRALCYDPVGAKVYTADYGGGTVSVIGGERPEVVASVSVGRYPSALVWDSHDNKVYCANADSSRVAVIDAGADTVIARLTVGSGPCALSYDSINDYVYCACEGSAAVYVIDAHRDSVLGAVTVGSTPIALVWNPIGLRTYVANYSGHSVSVIRDSVHVGLGGQPQASSHKPQTTVIRGVLFLPRDMTETSDVSHRVPRPVLLNAVGRKMMDLRPGANDVRSLAPGVYFVRAGTGSREQGGVRIRKVVVTR